MQYVNFFESTRLCPQTCTIQSHHLLNLDHQEGPKSEYLDKINFLYVPCHGMVCFWSPWHHTYTIVLFTVIIDSTLDHKEAQKCPNCGYLWYVATFSTARIVVFPLFYYKLLISLIKIWTTFKSIIQSALFRFYCRETNELY